jgi:predicted RecB family nuclease
VTWDPLPRADEGRVCGEFWTWLMATRAAAHAAGKTFAAYCYTRTEDKFMLDSARRFAGVEGVPPVGVVREFVNSREWVDIFATITDQFICPTGKGLKKLAPVAGFRWRDPEASGEASMVWYRAGVGYDGAEPDPAQRRRVLDYNEDDVRATAALREWMTHRADRETPPASQL